MTSLSGISPARSRSAYGRGTFLAGWPRPRRPVLTSARQLLHGHHASAFAAVVAAKLPQPAGRRRHRVIMGVVARCCNGRCPSVSSLVTGDIIAAIRS